MFPEVGYSRASGPFLAMQKIANEIAIANGDILMAWFTKRAGVRG